MPLATMPSGGHQHDLNDFYRRQKDFLKLKELHYETGVKEKEEMAIVGVQSKPTINKGKHVQQLPRGDVYASLYSSAKKPSAELPSWSRPELVPTFPHVQ